jgi:hypothetical protein
MVGEHRDHKIEIERGGWGWNVSVFTSAGELLWDDCQYLSAEAACEDAKHVINESMNDDSAEG